MRDDENVRNLLSCLPRVQSWFARRVRDPHTVDDLCQETLVAAWRAFPAFRGESSLSTWMHGVAKRVLWRHFRSTRDAPLTLDDVDDLGPGVLEFEERPLGAERLFVEMALERCCAGENSLYRSFYVERMTMREIARATGEPEGTIKYRLFMLRKKIGRLA